MKSEDFEKAAAHVHRFLSIDETTLKLTAGDVAQGTFLNPCLKSSYFKTIFFILM